MSELTPAFHSQLGQIGNHPLASLTDNRREADKSGVDRDTAV